MVACISHSLNVHERNYSPPQGEMLAAVWAVKTFHTYLHGTDFTFKVTATTVRAVVATVMIPTD
eukprot:1138829-Pelagomonas_calceolata.AAC.1